MADKKMLTEEQAIEELQAWKLDYDRDAEMALHCKHCLDEFNDGVFGDYQSPREAMNYEAVSCRIPLSDGRAVSVVSIWCKRCGRPVWDSSHLMPRY